MKISLELESKKFEIQLIYWFNFYKTRYGLGFNVSYHYSDVVGFIFWDQFILFDPHGRESSWSNVRSKDELYQRRNGNTIFSPNSVFLEHQWALPNFDGTNSLNGTIFRLPFRIQAEKSQLSKSFYSVAHILQTLKRFCWK